MPRLGCVFTLGQVERSATGVALASAPNRYLGLADRAECSAAVLARALKKKKKRRDENKGHGLATSKSTILTNKSRCKYVCKLTSDY